MANINILDKTIFNRIAAGEVVERPSSVVKELVENSIDALATNIIIEIEGGGISKIRVTDNGIGMDKENLPKAFLPHATSKISSVNDLDKIGTLGFRGEALSSIAAVSKVTAISKIKSNEVGSKIIIAGGEILEVSEIGCTDGTSIAIEDLFYCVPARAKFLKKPKSEEIEITNIVTRLILGNPKVQIKYVVDGKIVYNSLGTNLKDAIYTIYGATAFENVIEVDYTYQNLIKVYGFVGKPSFTKANRTYQTLIINGRYVVNKTISTAVFNAYEPYLMKNSFPFYALHLSIPLDKIDVNVHPNKLDVKFENGNLIFSAFFNPISDLLTKLSSQIRTYQEEIKESENAHLNLDNLKTISTNIGHVFEANKSQLLNEAIIEEDETSANNDIVSNLKNSSYNLNNDELELKDSINSFINTNTTNFEAKSDATSNLLVKLASQSHVFSQSSIFSEEQKVDLTKVKIIGTCFNTYIIVESGDSIYFIDQHAGHERLIYDKFKDSFLKNNLAIQNVIVPYVLDTNHLESQFINDNINIFNELGFEIEPFGINSFKISTVPVLLKDISLHNFFNSVLKDLNNVLNLNKADILKEYLEKSACRSAVKANDILAMSEIENLLSMLNKENQILLCPHGRPVIIEVTNKEIEKWFKRIV